MECVDERRPKIEDGMLLGFEVAVIGKVSVRLTLELSVTGAFSIVVTGVKGAGA